MSIMVQFLAQVPDFGGGQAPPGAEKLLQIGRWVLWCASFVAVIGFIYLGAQMFFAHQHGELQQQGKKLGAAMAGCVLISAATGIAGALITG